MFKFSLQELVDTFNFINYDSLNYCEAKIDPRNKIMQGRDNSTELNELMYAVTKGDINAIRRY